MRFVPFKDEFLPSAAEILANRHKRERTTFPELPSGFEEPTVARTALEAEWKRPKAAGIAVFDDEDQLVGYMIGYRLIDEFWGRSGWVRYPGMALAHGISEELYRDMYAKMAAQWVKEGYFRHFVFAPAANQAVIEAWLRLGFAYQQAYALMDLHHFPGGNDFEPPQDVTIRRGRDSDREALRTAADWICTYQAQSPGWVPAFPEVLEEIRDGYAGIVDDGEADLWLAVRNGELVGLHAYWPATSDNTNMIIPDKCIELKVAVTRRDEQGTGIGGALVSHCLNELRAKGYRYCTADWYVLNLLSSRYWPKRGFRPVMYRLVRNVDERVAWAKGGSA